VTADSVAVVVPVFNKIHCLREAAASIIEATRAESGVDLRFVDNGSTDGSLELLQSMAPVGAIIGSTARTIAAVRNEGARQANGRILLFLDCDVLVPRDYIARVRRVFADPSIAASGCECGLPPAPRWVERTWYRLTVREESGFRHYINSAAFAIRRALFEEVRGFPEELVTAEDYEICRRLVARGHKLWQAGELRVAHLDNPKTVGQFVRKSYWHGLGAARAAPRGRVNLPTAAAAAHLLSSTAALLMLIVGLVKRDAGAALGAAAAIMIVPLAVYAYRCLQVRRVVAPFRGLLLVQLFLLARAGALLSVVVGRGGRTGGRIAPRAR
jgi:GT2 family glycosyltransferase